jgi:hypothetical protein
MSVGEWSELAECLVELDFAIEDRESWVTRNDDVAELEQLERLRDDVRAALAAHWQPLTLRRRMRERHHLSVMKATLAEPRD